MSLSLITDRTNADYLAWLALSKIPWSSMTTAQKAIWSVPMKGAYNYTDLNRVGTALEYLQTLFASYGYSAAVSLRTNWTTNEWPTETEMADYLQGIANIRAVLAVFSTTPTVPSSMDDGTVIIWNNIEKILLDVETAISGMSAAFRYCGELICGEDQ